MGVGIFISHSSADTADAVGLDEALRHPRGLDPHNVEVETWLDKEDIPLNRDYASEIVAGQRRCQSAVFLLTDAALASDEVRSEWELAKSRGLKRFVFMPDVAGQLSRLPDAWQHLLGDPKQVRPWRGAAQAVAEIYLELGLQMPHCPCGKPIPYDRCHARWRPPPLPDEVTSSQLMRRNWQGVVPLGVLESEDALGFHPEASRHLQCIGPRGSGKTNLVAALLAGASRCLPLYDTFLVTAQPDLRLTSLRTTVSARLPGDYPRVVAGVLAALQEQRPCLLVIDELHVLPLADFEPLTEVIDDARFHLALTHAIGFTATGDTLFGRALSRPHLRVQLQQGVVEFGRPSGSYSPPGRATVWSQAWQGPKSAQLVKATEASDDDR